MKQIQISTLASGLTVATDSMSSVESISLGVWIQAGARLETYDISGLAHFLEHMAFKGTTTRNAKQLAEMIENVGGYMNAYTSRENTAYYVKLLHEHTERGFEFLSDILARSIFDTAEVNRERGVILQEIGMYQDTPDDLVFDYFGQTAYPNQPMGWPVIGRAEVVQQVQRQHFIDFIDTHYGAQNMYVVAAGRLKHDDIVSLAQRHFNFAKPKSNAAVVPATYQGGDMRFDKKLEQVNLVVGFPGVSHKHEDYYTQAVYSTMMGGGMSSRLFQEIRERRGLVYSIYSFSSPASDSGIWGIYAGTGEKEVGELVPVLIDELKKSTHQLTAHELERAKAQIKSSLLMGLESSSKRAETLAQHLMIFGRPLSVDELITNIEKINLSDVHRFAERLIQQHPTVASLGPITHMPDFATMTQQLKQG